MGKNQLQKAKALLERLHQGTLAPEEEQLLLRWLNQYTQQREKLADEALDLASEQLKERLDQYVEEYRPGSFARFRYYWAAACLALMAVGVGAYFLLSPGDPAGEELTYDRAPGQDKAILILEDGRQIELGESIGDPILGDDYQIRQSADSGLVYDENLLISAVHSSTSARQKVPVNTVRTQRGGEYRVVLPDGSLVWLNSDSRITFPVQFGETREVTVVGEAYFQVKRDEDRPFIVHADRQWIDVLGTEFNVNAYPDRDYTETVLVTGSLRASSATHPDVNRVIQPGQYARIDHPQMLEVSTANVSKLTAWTRGDFYFEDETLPEILEVLSRWYDVDITYRSDLTDKGRFGGVIARDKKLSTVLQMLESTGKVKFKITEKEVVLMD